MLFVGVHDTKEPLRHVYRRSCVTHRTMLSFLLSEPRISGLTKTRMIHVLEPVQQIEDSVVCI